MIVGVGLIGGSIGLALRARKLARRVVGAGSRPATVEAAQKRGAIDQPASDIMAAAGQADLVIVCAPVAHIAEQVCRLAPHCRQGTLITDAGSTKLEIVNSIMHDAGPGGDWGRGVRFVGSHPLAGNEKSGPVHASAELFQGRTVVVTPAAHARPEDVAAIGQFWTSLGARVCEMSPEEHDRALAATSHLPHLLAAALAAATPEEWLALTAGGWHDTTRIAAGDPGLWRQIMLANRDNLLLSLDRLEKMLAQFRTVIAQSNGPELQRLLDEGKQRREASGG